MRPSLAIVLRVAAPPPATPRPAATAMPLARLSTISSVDPSRLLWSTVLARLIASLAARSALAPMAVRRVWYVLAWLWAPAPAPAA